MQVSIDQSFFGKIPDQQINRKKLKRKFRKHIPSIINYCQTMARKLKKRNQNQVILFPHDYAQEESTDIQLSLQKQYNQAAPYFFYLSKSNLFIDNHHLKIMEKATPVSVKFDLLGFGKVTWFADWVQQPETNYLIGVTNTNWILIISVLEKGFFKYRIQDKNKRQNAKIVSVYSFHDNLYIFSEKQCHIVQYNNLKNPNKGLNKILQTHVTDKKISKGAGLQKDNKFFIFSLVQNTLIMQIVQLGLLLKKENSKKNLFRSQEGNLLNLQIFPKKTNNVINQIIIAFATNKQVIIMSYYLQTEFCSILARKSNPNLSWRNFKKIQIPLLTFLPRQNYLLCAIAFKYKLFFIKLWPDYCQISRRIKFQYPVEYVGQIGSDSGIIIVLNLSLPDMQKKRILLTHQTKLISFNRCVNIELVDKFQLNIQINSASPLQLQDIRKSLMIFGKKEILILNNDSIERVVLNTWNNIYSEMVQTENIKLLKFLILLKYVKSPLLCRPDSFEGLESFFPNQTHEEKQILLQYYYVMNMIPQRVDLTQSPQIMIPFIIQHKINNLPDETVEKLMDWCVDIDKRLVQQMIIGGAECGWEIAVSEGWIRAFKIMVQGGMQIQMPILKLYSMALSQKHTSTPQTGLYNEQLTQLGQRYVNQIVQYILFVLTSFYTDLLGDGNNLEFKHCILVILQQQVWNFIIKYAPQKAVNIISSLFIYKCRISEINRYSFKDFIIFNKKFSQLVPSQGYSNSEIVLSHMSETFRLLNGSQFRQQLILEHSKLLILKYQQYCSINKNRQNNLIEEMKIYQLFNSQADQQHVFSQQFIDNSQKMNSKTYFSFRKQYLKSILFSLSRNQNQNLENVYRQFRKHDQNDQDQTEFQCEMIDFLIYIWKQTYFKILKEACKQKTTPNSEINSFEQKGKKIRRLVKQQIRLFLAQMQQQNFKYQYLVIHVMMSIDTDNEFTSKIFNRFLKCKSKIVKNRIFSWLNQTLPQNVPLQEELIHRLKEVISINEQESRQILQRFYKGKQKEIIKRIDNDPNLQLEYVELIIKDASEVVEKYYTNLHMQLVLKLKPQQFISIININNDLVQYDILQILNITLQMGDFQQKNQILINLYEKQGEIVKCINTYLNRIEHLVYSYISLSEKNYLDEQEEIISFLIRSLVPLHDNSASEKTRLVQQISFRYEESIKLIFRQHQLHYKFIQIYLNKFTSLLQNIPRQNYKYKDHYINFISEYFGAFIILLFQRGILHHLSTWIKGYSGKIDFLLLIIEYFVEGYDTLRLQFVILKSMVRMERRILVKDIHSTLKQLQFCISSQSLCHVCNRTFNSDNIELSGLLFNCGHLYHKQCIDQVNGQDFCYYCISKNQYKSLIQNIEDDKHRLCLVDLLNKYNQKKDQMMKLINDKAVKEVKQRTALLSIEKKRTNRLGIYDKKVTAIQNQAEIIDLKLMIEEYYDKTQNDK